MRIADNMIPKKLFYREQKTGNVRGMKLARGLKIYLEDNLNSLHKNVYHCEELNSNRADWRQFNGDCFTAFKDSFCGDAQIYNDLLRCTQTDLQFW